MPPKKAKKKSAKNHAVNADDGNGFVVYCRVRPRNKNVDYYTDGPGKELIYKWTEPGKTRKKKVQFSWRFSRVLPSDTMQDRAFEITALPLIQQAFQGHNVTLFAYGQSGSGKTHTIVGDLSTPDHPQRGIVPRAIEAIMKEVESNPMLSETTIMVSYLEIYKEKCYDLLEETDMNSIEDMSRVHILYTGDSVHINNLTIMEVLTADDAVRLLNKGEKMRHRASTVHNATSTRSHCVFTFYLTLPSGLQSKMHFVDLAGCEKVTTEYLNNQVVEASSINLSLHYLEHVIMALQKNQNHKHVPFRNSLLTTILRDSLGANARTAMIANLSFMPDHMDQTRLTCAFAQRLRNVQNKAWNEVKENEMKEAAAARKRALAAAQNVQFQHLDGSMDYQSQMQPQMPMQMPMQGGQNGVMMPAGMVMVPQEMVGGDANLSWQALMAAVLTKNVKEMDPTAVEILELLKRGALGGDAKAKAGGRHRSRSRSREAGNRNEENGPDTDRSRQSLVSVLSDLAEAEKRAHDGSQAPPPPPSAVLDLANKRKAKAREMLQSKRDRQREEDDEDEEEDSSQAEAAAGKSKKKKKTARKLMRRAEAEESDESDGIDDDEEEDEDVDDDDEMQARRVPRRRTQSAKRSKMKKQPSNVRNVAAMIAGKRAKSAPKRQRTIGRGLKGVKSNVKSIWGQGGRMSADEIRRRRALVQPKRGRRGWVDDEESEEEMEMAYTARMPARVAGGMNGDERLEINELRTEVHTMQSLMSQMVKESRLKNKVIEDMSFRLEDEEAKMEEDPFISSQMLWTMCVMVMLLLVGASLIRLINIYQREDPGWYHLLYRLPIFFLLMSITCLFLSFPLRFLASVLLHIIFPREWLDHNSKFYSVKRGSNAKRYGKSIPPTTIMIPIYTEPWDAVIKKTLQSAMAAVHYYRLHGGKSSIVVCDDGMMYYLNDDRELFAVVDEAVRSGKPPDEDWTDGMLEVYARLTFYYEHGNYLAWCSRSRFFRAGAFKKASNMNFTLRMALAMERLMEDNPDAEPQQVLDAVVESVCQAKEVGTPCCAGGDLRIGDIMCILDSDSRMPVDALYATVPEFLRFPHLAFTQHLTIPLAESYQNFFSRFIALFTCVLFELAFATGSRLGDMPPLVGHNAMLRWQAMKEVAVEDEHGDTKFWSEEHVSEDFDMAVRLAVKSYFGKYIAWPGQAFQEGVTFTFYDEAVKLKKFAYGIAEVLFHPLDEWICGKGVWNQRWKDFIWCSEISWTTKMSTLSYMGTYLAMGSGILVAPFLLMGFCGNKTEYERSFFVDPIGLAYISLGVFLLSGSMGMISIRYRIQKTHDPNALRNVVGDVAYMSFISTLFWPAILFTCFEAVVKFLFRFKISFGATGKDADAMYGFTVWEATVDIFSRWWHQFLFFSVLFAGILVEGVYEVEDICVPFAVQVGLGMQIAAHLLVPFLLSTEWMYAVMGWDAPDVEEEIIPDAVEAAQEQYNKDWKDRRAHTVITDFVEMDELEDERALQQIEVGLENMEASSVYFAPPARDDDDEDIERLRRRNDDNLDIMIDQDVMAELFTALRPDGWEKPDDRDDDSDGIGPSRGNVEQHLGNHAARMAGMTPHQMKMGHNPVGYGVKLHYTAATKTSDGRTIHAVNPGRTWSGMDLVNMRKQALVHMPQSSSQQNLDMGNEDNPGLFQGLNASVPTRSSSAVNLMRRNSLSRAAPPLLDTDDESMDGGRRKRNMVSASSLRGAPRIVRGQGPPPPPPPPEKTEKTRLPGLGQRSSSSQLQSGKPKKGKRKKAQTPKDASGVVIVRGDGPPPPPPPE